MTVQVCFQHTIWDKKNKHINTGNVDLRRQLSISQLSTTDHLYDVCVAVWIWNDDGDDANEGKERSTTIMQKTVGPLMFACRKKQQTPYSTMYVFPSPSLSLSLCVSFSLQSELKSYRGCAIRWKLSKETREVSKEVDTCNRSIHFVNIKWEKSVYDKSHVQNQYQRTSQ